MRISTNTIYDMGLAGMQQATSEMVKTQLQIAAGRRILTPSDDPIASARVLEVTQSQTLNLQYDTNMNSATSSLSMEDSILGSVSELITSVRTDALSAGSPSLTDQARAGIAAGLRGRYQELLGLANSTDGNGQYLFSGYKGANSPFSDASLGTVNYNGDQGQRLIQISPSRQLAVSDSGGDVFKRSMNGNGTIVSAAGGNNTNLVHPGTNLGTGVVSTGNVLDPTKWAANAENLTVKFNVAPPAPTTYDVTGSVTGTILTAQLYISGVSIDLTATHGIQFAVSGAPADGDTFTVQPSRNVDIFQTLGDLIKQLELKTSTLETTPTQITNSINTAIQNFDQSQTAVLKVRASVGTRMNEVDAVKVTGADLQLQYTQTISDLQDLDYTKAATDLARQKGALEAAQLSYTKIQGLSLFNYM